MPITPAHDRHHSHVVSITTDQDVLARLCDLPSSAAVHDVLAQEGVDATSLDDLMHYAGKRGWSWRITGGIDFPRCQAVTLAPWVNRAPWAQVWGDGPVEALSIALAVTIGRPPPVADE
jgi:hypothetical protein